MKFLFETFLELLCLSLYFLSLCYGFVSTIFPIYVLLVKKFLRLFFLNLDSWLADTQNDHEYFRYINYVIFVGFCRKVKNVTEVHVERFSKLYQAYVIFLFLVLKNKVEEFRRLSEEEKTHVRLFFVLILGVYFWI